MNSTIAILRLLPLAAAAFVALLAGCAGAPAVPPPPPCSGLCTTHEDGYQWALRGTLSDPKQCESPSYPDAFKRGCLDAVNDYSQMRPTSTGL
ncbi:hypothetical protein [Solimonas soli]|uniref:hypothetical protein n=1 Tax=Solimonas soli TaxID=413479 RepID=UPI00047FEDF9|nr:hypothetical protein [Solimonas soli]